jgi:PPK2 family polyphosphate:nucleotide phosphotransferase
MDFRKRLRAGKRFDLRRVDPASTPGVPDEAAANQVAERNREKLAHLQNKLWAQHEHAVLIVLQAMDAGGKDGTIRHVMSGVNPQGCSVTSFKQPTQKELDHDFLWRIHQATPPVGSIGIFNRSHYEDVLVARVHNIVPKTIWTKRYRQISEFERMLSRNRTVILKFFLHISREEQERRLQARLSDPEKHWKSSPQDFSEREFWDEYQQAYHDAITETSRGYAPWYVIPADHKWYRNAAISRIIVDTLDELHLQYPQQAAH